ncbi:MULTISPECIES: alpha/beta fold hydrolase [Pseudomonas fluorescens group]|uniref:Alpha/beta fold hydrolase n=1 Tax=Pseudomonas fluorescens TaxID=294 RepID=A0AAE2Q2J8_PSEFL|nr:MULTISPECIES: alpha/beta fold hydrolase [Pseudomonas fluorescens group]MBA1429379.1 alpha/beta fold hydrolase [Pseudomonas orientalis]MBD8273040.1 alpha/beta fold hydrolase [Pseudomonas fluorescens]
MKKLYVTGGTGFLGSHFIYRHLLTGEFDVTCLVRGRDDNECRHRIRDAVLSAGQHYPATETRRYFDGLKARRADITQPMAGMDIAQARALASEQAVFLHFASSLNFEEKNRDIIYEHNINGLNHAFDAARALGCKTFFYISTAYTAGVGSGEVQECLHESTEFNNYYEETKCAAEHLIDRLCTASGIELVIIRPSIVIGPQDTKTAGGSTTGLYGFLREVNRLKRAMRNTEQTVRLSGKPHARVNLVPVDQVCQDIMRVYDNLSNCPRGIFHATSSTNIEVRVLLDIISRAIELGGLQIDESGLENPSAIEKLLARKTVFYNPYIHNTKTFLRADGGGCALTIADVEGYINGGVAALSQRKPDLLRQYVIDTQDRVPLNVYASADKRKETVVFINAVGMPLELANRLREALEDDFRFVTWESRGIPSPVDDIDAIDVSVAAHIGDLQRIFDYFDIEKAHVIGWCSGAYIAYHARKLKEIASLTLISGAYGLVGAEEEETAFMRNLRQVLPLISQSRSQAERFHASFFARSGSDNKENATQSRQSSEILDATDPNLIHLTSLPFESAESLYCYSRVITALQVGEYPLQDERLAVPCHVISGSCDDAVSPHESRRFIELHEGAVYSEIAGMDHFGLYNHLGLLDVVTQYIKNLGPVAPVSQAPA